MAYLPTIGTLGALADAPDDDAAPDPQQLGQAVPPLTAPGSPSQPRDPLADINAFLSGEPRSIVPYRKTAPKPVVPAAAKPTPKPVAPETPTQVRSILDDIADAIKEPPPADQTTETSPNHPSPASDVNLPADRYSATSDPLDVTAAARRANPAVADAILREAARSRKPRPDLRDKLVALANQAPDTSAPPPPGTDARGIPTLLPEASPSGQVAHVPGLTPPPPAPQMTAIAPPVGPVNPAGFPATPPPVAPAGAAPQYWERIDPRTGRTIRVPIDANALAPVTNAVGAAAGAVGTAFGTASGAFKAAPVAVGETLAGQNLPGHEGESGPSIGSQTPGIGGALLDRLLPPKLQELGQRLYAHGQMILSGNGGAVDSMGVVGATTNPPDSVSVSTSDEDAIHRAELGQSQARPRSTAEMVTLETGRRGLDMLASMATDPTVVALGGVEGRASDVIAAAFSADGIAKAVKTAQDPKATREDVAAAALGAALQTLPAAAHYLVPKIQAAMDARTAETSAQTTDAMKILGVSPEVARDPDALRSAYLEKAKATHPDIPTNDQSGAQFQVVEQAYKWLIDNPPPGTKGLLSEWKDKLMKGMSDWFSPSGDAAAAPGPGENITETGRALPGDVPAKETPPAEGNPAGREFVPVGEEAAYNGPERRSGDRVSSDAEDQLYTDYREKLARGEDVVSPAAKARLAQTKAVEDYRDAAGIKEVETGQVAPPLATSHPILQEIASAIGEQEAPQAAAEPTQAAAAEHPILSKVADAINEPVPEHPVVSKIADAIGETPTTAVRKGSEGPLNTEETRELRRMLAEMQSIPYTARTRTIIEGAPRGKDEIWTAGAGGAPVFNDIGGGTRADVTEAIQRVLDGKKPNAAGRRAIIVARARIADDGRMTTPSLPLSAGESGVPPSTPDEARAAANARVADPSDLNFLARRYDEQSGPGKPFGRNVVSRDNAKELFYPTGSNEDRTRLNDAVSDAAGKVADAAYARRLAEAKGPDATVVLTSGGTGSGKSTAATQTERGQAADVVYDSQGRDVAAMGRRIAQAKASGRTVDHVHVYRDPVDAWTDGVLPRTEDTGRPVSIEGHVRSHVEALRAAIRVADAHANDPSYHLTVVDNTGRQVREIPSEEARAFLTEKAKAYNAEDVRQVIREGTDRLHAAGVIPDDVYHAYVDRPAGRDGVAEGRGPSGHGSTPEEVPGGMAGSVPERGVIPAAASARPEDVAPKHEFSSTQVELPPATAAAIKKFAASIPADQLADDGREDEPHVTVKYGLHTNELADVQRVLQGEGPITVTLGKTSIFPASENGQDYDVVKADVHSPDLHRLNQTIAEALPHTDTHPEYRPHATIAYVKAGLGKQYAGRTDLEGLSATLPAITFSDKDGEKHTIPLGGAHQAVPSYKPGNPFASRAVSARLKANRLSTPSAHERGMAESFPLGAGFGHGSVAARAKNMDASVGRAKAAVDARREADYLDAQARAFDAGKINAQGRRISPESQKRSEKREIYQEKRDERIARAKAQLGDKPKWQVPPDVWADSTGNLGGGARQLMLGDHRDAVEQALSEGHDVPSDVLAAYPDLKPATPQAPATPITSPHIEIAERTDDRGPYYMVKVRGRDGSIHTTASTRSAETIARIRSITAPDAERAGVEVNRVFSETRAPVQSAPKDTSAAGVKTYAEDKRAQPYEVLEDDYLAHRRAGQVRNYERGITDEEAKLAALGPKATASKEKIKGTIAAWTHRLNKLKTGTRDDALWRREYIETVKKAISQGRAVPAAIVAQRPEFTKAVDARARYDKGRHTSFANKSAAVDSGTVADYGIKVKRQDGEPITDEQVRHITTALREVETAIGPLGNVLRALDPTVAHTNGKFPFMRGDAGGLYSPDERTISVGISDMLGRPIRAFAHELGHLLDISAGAAMGVSRRVHRNSGSGSYESHSLAEVDSQTARLIRDATQRINDTREVGRLVKAEIGKQETPEEKADVQRAKVQLGAYWRSPREVFARLFEQYVADELGKRSEAADRPEVYQRQPGWWTREVFAELKPMVKTAIDERLDILRDKYGIQPETTTRSAPLITEGRSDILDTGEEQPRLHGAESARQVGKADTTFKAPQQASGEDFGLSAEETPEATAAREHEENGPSLFGAEENSHAIAEGQQSENDLEQHPDGNVGREAAEAGGSDRAEYGAAATSTQQPREVPPPEKGQVTEGGTTLQSAVIPGAKEFFEQDVAPVARGLVQIATDFKNLITPQSASPEAQRSADVVREAKATAVNAAALESAKHNATRAEQLIRWLQRRPVPTNLLRTFDARTDAENIAAISAYERTGTFPNAPEGYGKLYGESMTLARELLQHAYGDDAVGYIENYVRRAFEFGSKADEDKGTSFLVNKRRTLSANRTPLKGRVLDMPLDEALAEMRARGIKVKPQSTNPEMLRQWSLANAHQAAAMGDARRTLEESGLIQWVPASVPGSPALPVLDIKASGPRAGRIPEGYEAISDRGMAAFAPKKRGLGTYYADPNVARVLNNATSKGLGGSPTYAGLRAINNSMNQLQLGLSAFHATGSLINAGLVDVSTGIRRVARGDVGGAAGIARGLSVLGSAPRFVYKGRQFIEALKADDPEAFTILHEQFNPAGGRLRVDTRYRNAGIANMLKAWRSHNIIGAALRVPFAVVEAVANPLMSYAIPRLKIGVLLDRMADIRRRLPNATPEELAREYAAASDQVDNIFGLLVYDNGFWSETAKDLAQLGTRSVGWTGGSLRWGAGAAADIGRMASAPFRKGAPGDGHRSRVSDRVLDAAILPIFVGMIGAAYMYLHTKKRPKDLRDYYYPENGRFEADGRPSRTSMPTYMKDVFAYGNDPFSTLLHKGSPIADETWSLLRNEDYWGDMIANPHDGASRRWADRGKYLLQENVPFAVSQSARARDQGASRLQQAESFAGFTTAPRSVTDTPAEKMMHSLHVHTPLTPEQAQLAKVRSQVKQDLRTGTPEARAEARQLAAGTMTSKQLASAAKAAHRSALQAGFQSLPIDQALDVYEVASPEERASIRPALVKKSKLVMAAPADERAALRARFRDAIGLPVGRVVATR